MRSFDKFGELMAVQRYSMNTINTYTGLLIAFQKRIGLLLPLDELSDARVLEFFKNYVLENKYSYQSQKQLCSALKLYYKIMHETTIEFTAYAARKPQRRLPVIPSLIEVQRILNGLDNQKHSAMLTTIYALGLRSGELINLKIVDLDGDRNQVFIRNAKGRKDRIIPFPETLKTILRDYFIAYRPKRYLFEGHHQQQYTASSLRKVFHKACKTARIHKKLNLHSLRHAYATHLMEAGTDLRVIKELLGHNSIKTTLIYTHVTNKTLENVPSPIDFLPLPRYRS
jgi:site-specific recombinase XerD